MVIRIKTAALSGIEGLAVMVEVDLSRGLPGFYLVGLPNAEVRESRQRVLAALRNCGIKMPAGKITVNLAPAGVRKEGASFDLAIAMGVMAAQGKSIHRDCLRPHEAPLYLGELSLSGKLLPVRGLLAMVMAARERGDRLVVVPQEQAQEASLVNQVRVLGVSTLQEAIHWWDTGQEPERGKPLSSAQPVGEDSVAGQWIHLEGQPSLLKAAVLAATGRHNILMVGPPGSGKTRLARLLGAHQAPMTARQALDVTRIHSARGMLPDGRLLQRRPFRAPHHTMTRAGLIGGGSNLRPGEVTLAHGGVLFLDELTQFGPGVLEALREPLEEGFITLDKGPGHRQYPADFQLVAAMNPCHCGFLGSADRPCRCTAAQRRRHLGRLSGPLLDRFDLFVQVVDWEGNFLGPGAEQRNRGPASGWRNSATTGGWSLPARPSKPLAASQEALQHLDLIRKPLGMSLRSVTSCLKVAGTIARLDGQPRIEKANILEALEFRLENLALESLG